MKRLSTLLLALACLGPCLMAVSLHPHALEQPFDSQAALAATDFSSPLSEAEQQYAGQCHISVLVMGSLGPLYSWFGHVAFLLEEPDGRSIVYDYGVFDTSKPGFFLDFLKGRMLYNVWRTNGSWRLQDEKESGRSIIRYDLPLSDSQKIGVVRFLEENTSSGNDQYLYHFYKDNCSTRIRDILDAATGGAFKTWAEAQPIEPASYRSEANRKLSRNPALCWVLNLLQGPSVDFRLSLWDAMFLPETLGTAIGDFFGIQGEVLQEDTIADKDGSPFLALVVLPLSIGLCLACLLILVREKPLWHWMMGTILFILGMLSCVLLYCMCLTDLDMTWGNATILYLNPLLFGAMREIHKGKEECACRILRGLSLLVLAVLVFSLCGANGSYIGTVLLVLPLYLTAWVRGGRSAKLRFPSRGTASLHA
ncbi:MAG: DUF4105 domain-containing protein [Sphaerochaetaceae bacterium]|nr:DUF4105 domain-containing protein [Spirochaetales bacterium]MDY5500162.1 DUF4105 domain-containing protein [Sphaerochaetaceae bacterium]